MKSLESVFVANYDKSGDNTFRQLRKEGAVALYVRESMEGLTLWYELFTFKTIKAGTPLPGGNTVQEDYEQYPGKSAFGKTAWVIAGENDLARANARFDELVKTASDKSSAIFLAYIGEEETDEAVPVLKVEKLSSETIKIPVGQFTHSELADANQTGKSQVYFILQDMVKAGSVKVVGTRKPAGGRGKPSNVFEKS